MCRRVEQILERTEFPVRSPRGAVSTLPRGRLGLRGASGSPRRPRSGLCRSRRPVSRLQRDESAAAAARTRVSHPSARAAVLSDDGQWTPYAPTPVRKPTPGIPVWTLAQDQHRRECRSGPTVTMAAGAWRCRFGTTANYWLANASIPARLARRQYPNTILFVTSGIILDRSQDEGRRRARLLPHH